MRLFNGFRGAVPSVAVAVLMLAASPALARHTTFDVFPPGVPASAGAPPMPGDTEITTNPKIGQTGPGTDSARAANPAPGATGPYLGHGTGAFYDVQARIDRVEQRARTQLSGARKRKALYDIRSIRAELATQKARHGGALRDWDRENLNHRLDQMEAEVGLGRPARGV